MKPVTSSIVAGLAGKVSLVVGVLGLGVGTAAAAGADVPLITPSAPAIETEVESVTSDDTGSSSGTASDTASSDEANHGAVVSEFARTTDLEGCERGQAVAELASGGNHQAQECSDDESTDESSADESSGESSATESSDESSATESSDETSDDANHGQLVSEFARTTDLEGCEKGQAIAELASGGNHVAKDCGDDDESSADEPETTVAAPAPATEAPATTSPGRSGDAPGRSGDAPKGGNGHGNGNGRGGNDEHGNGRNGG